MAGCRKKRGALVYRIGYQLTTADQVLRSPDDAAHIKEQHALFARVYLHWSRRPLQGVGYAPGLLLAWGKRKTPTAGFTVAVEVSQ